MRGLVSCCKSFPLIPLAAVLQVVRPAMRSQGRGERVEMRVQGLQGEVQAFGFLECDLGPLERARVKGGWGRKGWLWLVMGSLCLRVSWRI